MRTIDDILGIINNISYQNISETIVYTKDLVRLREEVLKLRANLDTAKRQRSEAIADGLKVLSQSDMFITRFDSYV